MKKRIKVAMANAGLTLKDIADELGRPLTLTSFILNGKHNGKEHRPRIAALLGLQESDIPCPPRKPKRERRSPR